MHQREGRGLLARVREDTLGDRVQQPHARASVISSYGVAYAMAVPSSAPSRADAP